MKTRASGLLLHISSLPSRYGIGDFGPEAYRFVDFLKKSGQIYWQILPLTPTDPRTDNSPYLSQSTFAMNPALISPELLASDGLIDPEKCPDMPDSYRIQHRDVLAIKSACLKKAYYNFQNRGHMEAFNQFCQDQNAWLYDFALFVCLRQKFNGRNWRYWPAKFKNRDPEILEKTRSDLADSILFVQFCQFIAYSQWMRLKLYCNERSIRIIGDLPIYVAYDSVDVWSHPAKFKLDANKRPQFVAGVPPDYFSATGQLWGNPVYNWDEMEKNHFTWWQDRLDRNLHLYDIVRIDHFRGLVAYWQVPYGEKTAIRGEWIHAPVVPLLEKLNEKYEYLPVIAEDLGMITPDVVEVMDRFKLPGMKVLMFAFSEDIGINTYIPHNLSPQCILYTGTHDNNTLHGWYYHEITASHRSRVEKYIGRRLSKNELHWDVIRLAMQSVAKTVIFPVQDILGLGENHRMNNPAKRSGNWRWRLKPHMLTDQISKRLDEMAGMYGRK